MGATVLDDLDELLAENKALRAALAPFAKIAADYEAADEQRAQHYRDEGREIGPHSDGHRVSIGLGECRAARIALGHQQKAKP